MLPVEFLIEIPVVLRIVEVSLGILVNEFSLGCTECQPIFDALSQVGIEALVVNCVNSVFVFFFTMVMGLVIAFNFYETT